MNMFLQQYNNIIILKSKCADISVEILYGIFQKVYRMTLSL